jgi:hypothetical protein
MKKRILKILLIAASIAWVSCSVTRSPADIVRDENLHRQAAEAIDAGRFVLEGDELIFSRGGLANVDENVNFISVSPETVTIQTSFNNGRAGANNLGGITIEGHPDTPRITTDREGNVNHSVNVSGFFSARIELTLYKDSNQATATVYPNFRGGSITMNGIVLPLEKANVFFGTPTP